MLPGVSVEVQVVLVSCAHASRGRVGGKLLNTVRGELVGLGDQCDVPE